MSAEPKTTLNFPLDENKQEVPTPKILANKKQIPILSNEQKLKSLVQSGTPWIKRGIIQALMENFPKIYSNTANTMYL